ncbi:MAG: bifunctional adenosylcobinamide kinase/adenosylcobinamide-phosphate guanylyltransferase [SAR324 cluster bacterium]|jgi:adenosylcobinamide kinase/adenosylcobinamide-phosphate guanylyltransferase|tara:strand:- start:19 stop:516 length:498 start_codon:yes stop_codon:yes gene_type:complete
MKILFTGGVKSGKSRHAEMLILKMAQAQKPVYLATTELLDTEMGKRISEHRQRRGKNFKTIEEPLFLTEALTGTDAPVLIECMTMWLNNALHHKLSESKIFAEIESLLSLERQLVFVLNEVGLGIIPVNPLARKFADLSGRISQQLAEACDEVNWCVAGISVKIK